MLRTASSEVDKRVEILCWRCAAVGDAVYGANIHVDIMHEWGSRVSQVERKPEHTHGVRREGDEGRS